MVKKNKAYWKSRALFFEQQFKTLQERNRLLLDQNRLLAMKDNERQIEFDAKRAFMDKVESAYSEYQIACAEEPADLYEDHPEDWHAQIGGNDE